MSCFPIEACRFFVCSTTSTAEHIRISERIQSPIPDTQEGSSSPDFGSSPSPIESDVDSPPPVSPNFSLRPYPSSFFLPPSKATSTAQPQPEATEKSFAREDEICNPKVPEENTNKDAIKILKTNAHIRVGAVSAHIGKMDHVYAEALKTHKHWAEYHNYPFHDLNVTLMDDSSVWSKLPILISKMVDELQKPESERLGWLFWIDGDSMILNYCVPLQAFLPTDPDINVLIAADDFGVNAGVFGIRVSQWSIKYLGIIMGLPVLKPEVELRFAEQTGIAIVAEYPQFKGGLVKVPNRWFNAYKHPADGQDQLVQAGDMLLHFPGDGDARPKLMQEWLDKINSKAAITDGWITNWKTGHLGTEILEFWEKEDKKRKEEKQKQHEGGKNLDEEMKKQEEKNKQEEEKKKQEEEETKNAEEQKNKEEAQKLKKDLKDVELNSE